MAKGSALWLTARQWDVLEIEAARSGDTVQVIGAAAIMAYHHLQQELSTGHHVLAHRSSTDAADVRLYLTSVPSNGEVSINADAGSLETYIVTTSSADEQGRVIPFPHPEPPRDA